MNRRIINPWTWQYKHGFAGFVHANEVKNSKGMLFAAGQVSVDEEGNLLYPGDMVKQIKQIFDHIEVLLEQADFKLSDVMKLTYYTTDMQAFLSGPVQEVLGERMHTSQCQPATSLIGVASLSLPDCVIEIEVIAAK